MAGKLTTHVLDISRGTPAAGMKVSLFREGKLIRTAVTNRDGRIDGPMAAGEEFGEGSWRLEFSVGDYFGMSDLGAGRVSGCGSGGVQGGRLGAGLSRSAAGVALVVFDVSR